MELLKCPFCDGKPKKVTGTQSHGIRNILKIRCKDCFCQTDYYPYTRKTTPKAIIRWNTRPPQQKDK